jgi:Rieske Fe-S protein
MRNLFSGRRRYALACLLTVGGLITAAACAPTKTPPKEPAPSGLSIDPIDWDFRANPGTATFTVTNHGPNTTGALAVTLDDETHFDITGGDCENATVAVTGTCTVEAEFDPQSTGEQMTDLVVDDPNDGEARAILIGGP